MERMKVAILTIVAVVTLVGTVQWVRAGMPSEWPEPATERYEPSGMELDRHTGIVAYIEFDELAPAQLKRIAERHPTLSLENSDGDRAGIWRWRVDGGKLVADGIDGLTPVWYTLLVARYPDGTSEAFPVNVDLRSMGKP